MPEFVPFHMVGRCIASDEELYGNMEAAIARGYPEISTMEPARAGTVALIGSGPSVAGELERIRALKESGTMLVAVKDAHDWLLSHGIVPDYAFAIDPQEHRWNCFQKKHKDVHYLIASQCHPAMFDHLDGHRVTIWHPYIHKGQDRPKGKKFIGGATTSGLRALVVFYTMGWRNFALFGYDSCLESGKLRVNGDMAKESVIPIRLPNGEMFDCNPAMAHQAQHFQEHFDYLPDLQVKSYGRGLITSILKIREEYLEELAGLRADQPPHNDRISFIHEGPETMASYRYRVKMPAEWLGASINDFSASTLIFSKPQPSDLIEMERTRARGGRVIVDICDDHLDWQHYQEAIRIADRVTCSTRILKKEIVEKCRVVAEVIPEAYEYPGLSPHCQGDHLLWFGHHTNRAGLQRILPHIERYPLLVISNFEGAIPWSPEAVEQALTHADIVILPFTENYKSANRAVEALRMGCFVVAEPHPALRDIPGIWLGQIKEGIEWALKHLQQVNEMILEGQTYIQREYSPAILASAWRRVIQSPTTSAVDARPGLVGSMSM